MPSAPKAKLIVGPDAPAFYPMFCPSSKPTVNLVGGDSFKGLLLILPSCFMKLLRNIHSSYYPRHMTLIHVQVLLRDLQT